MPILPSEAAEITERLGPGSSTWVEHSAFHIARYQFAAGRVRGRRVLDAGTGLGYGAAILKSAGAAEVQAVDIDPGSIERARAMFRIDGLEYLVDDCEVLSRVHGPFDVICNFENIEHLRNPDAFLARAAQLLADDGMLICSTPERATSTWTGDRPENPYHTTEWYRHEFREMLSKSFKDVEMLVQVEGLWALRRREACENMNQHLSYLWNSPPVRLSRFVSRLLGRDRPWPAIDGLMAASPSDYPIVPEALANVLGGSPESMAAAGSMTFNVALCRSPR
jgi:2-polyprenyl-3-methyl-5-hydroxy-6-metoxy-1,4-benzoquinol methylase